MSGEGACTLREYHQAGAVLQDTSCVVIGTLYALGAALIYEDLATALAGFAHQRQIAQLLLHHPLEMAPQEAIHEEDIVRALVIGHEHIGLILLQILPSLYMHRQQHDVAHHPTPYMCRPITPEVCVAYGAADDGGKAGEAC